MPVLTTTMYGSSPSFLIHVNAFLSYLTIKLGLGLYLSCYGNHCNVVDMIRAFGTIAALLLLVVVNIMWQAPSNAMLQDMRQLKRDIRALEQEAKTMDHREREKSVFAAMNGSFKIRLLYLHALTDDDALVHEYAQFQRRSWTGLSNDHNIDIEEMMGWINEQKATSFWQQRIVAQTDADEYFHAAKWMAERLLYRDLCELNTKGISPPAQVLFDLFVANWREDTLNEQCKGYLERLTISENARTYWLRHFRQTWLATFRILPQRPPLKDAEIIRKVRQFIIIREFDQNKHTNIETKSGHQK